MNRENSSEKMFAIMKNQLPASMLTLFQTRYENGYDVPSASEQEIPWNIYKQQRDFLEGKSTNPNITLNHSISTDITERKESMLTIQIEGATIIPVTNSPDHDGDVLRSVIPDEQPNSHEKNVEPVAGPSSDCVTPN